MSLTYSSLQMLDNIISVTAKENGISETPLEIIDLVQGYTETSIEYDYNIIHKKCKHFTCEREFIFKEHDAMQEFEWFIYECEYCTEFEKIAYCPEHLAHNILTVCPACKQDSIVRFTRI